MSGLQPITELAFLINLFSVLVSPALKLPSPLGNYSKIHPAMSIILLHTSAKISASLRNAVGSAPSCIPSLCWFQPVANVDTHSSWTSTPYQHPVRTGKGRVAVVFLHSSFKSRSSISGLSHSEADDFSQTTLQNDLQYLCSVLLLLITYTSNHYRRVFL